MAKKSSRHSSVRRGYQILGFILLGPALISYIVFMGYPLYKTFWLSVQNWSGFGDAVFTGLQNFKMVMSDATFWFSLKNTLYFAFFSAVFSIVLGVLMAWLNLYLGRFEGQVFRTIMFIPNMISPTITGLLFMFIFTEDVGLLNNFLELIGLSRLTTAWLSNTATVKQVIVIATVWRQFGLTMILCYAGLQGIPNELVESARLDGAGEISIFTRVLLPLVKPQIEIATMFTMLGGLRIYDSVVSLTAGGPARQTVVLPMWIIENAFTYSKFGYAGSMCVMFLLVVLIFIAIIRFLFRGEKYEY